ncbi:MAG: hypothetical protein QF682_03845 [Candidatus Thermoplasmatota archaeon]|nr:hypothetical protein [Candidatus Thermoplasmatota archaeon]
MKRRRLLARLGKFGESTAFRCPRLLRCINDATASSASMPTDALEIHLLP